jgi:hypothetical protein
MLDDFTRANILDQACKLVCASERRAFLERACHGNMELIQDLEEVAKLEAVANQLIPESPEDWLPHEIANGDDEFELAGDLLGRRVGRYQVLAELGEGGFAIVYEAVPIDSEEPHVAIKVIKPGMDSREVLERFRREQRLMARMSHPHIARTYESGLTAQGRPYFVMELVPGSIITEYCDARRMTIAERIQLFLTVCDAVSYTHHKDILHRDLKPSNVLVMDVQGTHVAKVIDFGVAKSLTSDSLATFLSRRSQIVGTVGYMSPEQAEEGGPCDPRSDLYALAAILYELVTGCSHLGYEARTHRSSRWLKKLHASQPIWPSTLLRHIPPAERVVIANNRQWPSSAANTCIDRDLEVILVRALQRDPTRRYPDVETFAVELRRYLAGESVTASYMDFAYVLRDLARHYRHEAMLMASFLLALVVMSIVSVTSAWKAHRAEQRAAAALVAETKMRQNESRQRQEKLAAAERELAALRRSRELTDVVRILTEVHVVDAIAGPGSRRELPIQQILENTVEKVLPRFDGAPIVQATILDSVGWGYRSLNDYPAAMTHLSAALACILPVNSYTRASEALVFSVNGFCAPNTCCCVAKELQYNASASSYLSKPR